MKKELFGLYLCIASVHVATAAISWPIAEVDTTGHLSPRDTTVYFPSVDTTYYEPVDTGGVERPDVPDTPVIYIPTIREDANVTEYPHNPVTDEKLSSGEAAKQEFTTTLEGDYLRIKGTLMARGYGKHYIDCQIFGDSVHLQRFDMDPESTDMILHNVDIRIPGFTEDYYKITLAEQNNVPIYKQYMVMPKAVMRGGEQMDANQIAFQISTGIEVRSNNQSFLCTAPDAVKLEVYTINAMKVGEARFVDGQAEVKVNEAPATYLYIVTYPDGRRESGKVAVGEG